MNRNDKRIEDLYSKFDGCVAAGRYEEAKTVLDLIKDLRCDFEITLEEDSV